MCGGVWFHGRFFSGMVLIGNAFSFDEVAQYIETLKAYENRAPDIIKEKIETEPKALVSGAMTVASNS